MSTLSVGTIRSNTSSPPTVQNTSGTEIGTFCRAWVNFNGTGTVAINASFNVSSITDNGTGDYSANFSNVMSDANYSAIGMNGNGTSGSRVLHKYSSSTSSVRVQATNGAGTLGDYDSVSIAIFR